MELPELFSIVSPCVVGFISRLVMTQGVSAAPIFPLIIGTGFFVDKEGIVATNRHVVEVFDKIRPNPKTGASSLAAIMWFPGRENISWQMLAVDIRAWFGLSEFTSAGNWYGNKIPDIAFVQLGVRDVPSLTLATDDFYVRTGMKIATVGYPMGTIPLTVLGQLNQMTPFMRHGIVSSVFPFPTTKPHGFTIDIMQQGGSSGSPILAADAPTVIGVMSSGVIEWTKGQSAAGAFSFPQNTNISIAEPAHLLHSALEGYKQSNPVDSSTLPTLAELRAKHPEDPDAALHWESWIEPK